MNVKKKNLQWFLWYVKNNKGKNARKIKLFVVLGLICESALGKLGGRRGHLRKTPWCKKAGEMGKSHWAVCCKGPRCITREGRR